MNRQSLRRPRHAVIAVAGALFGAACFLVMHLVMTDVVDPLKEPVSSYALTSPGNALFALGTLGVALSCAVLAHAGIGLRDETMLRGGLAAASVLLVLVMLFRTDTGDSVTSAAGQIHRFAAGGAFVVLACSGWVVWRKLAATGQVTASAIGVLAVLGFGALLLTGLNTFFPELAGGGQWRGLPQRVLLTLQTALVVAMGLVAGRVSQGDSASAVVPAGRDASPTVSGRSSVIYAAGRGGAADSDMPISKCG